MTDKIKSKKILLNPGPATISARVKQALLTPDICPREKEVTNIINDINKKLLNLTNATTSHQVVLFASSGTGALEACFGSCMNSEQKLLILNNGYYGQRLVEICQNLDIDHNVLNFQIEQPINGNLLDKYLSDNYRQYSALAFVHHETSTGLLNNLSEINKIAKKYNLVTIADAMSSFAGIQIDLNNDHVDYIISSANKCLHGIAGVSFVIISNGEIDRLNQFRSKNYYFNLINNYNYYKNNGQFLFTAPVQVLYALKEAINELIETGGIAARYSHYNELYNKLLNGMQQLGFVPLIDKQYHSKILTSFIEHKDPNISFEYIHDYLYKYNITIYPGNIKLDNKNYFRLANMGDIDLDDITYFLDVLKECINEQPFMGS